MLNTINITHLLQAVLHWGQLEGWMWYWLLLDLQAVFKHTVHRCMNCMFEYSLYKGLNALV